MPLDAPAPGALAKERPLYQRWHRIGLFLLFALILAFHVSLIHDDIGWNGDNSLFIMHARNLVEGRPYGESGYIANPYRPGANMWYPPGFPLMLAPVYEAFDGAILPMKGVTIASFFFGLIAVAYLVRREVPPLYLGALVAIIGFSPLYAIFVGDIMSDLPFCLMVYLCLVAAQASDRAAPARTRQVGWAALAGAFMYYAFITRSLGIVLIPSFIVFDLAARRTVTWRTVVALGVFALGYGIQELIAASAPQGAPTAGAESYSGLVQQDLLDRVGLLATSVFESLADYVEVVSNFFWNRAADWDMTDWKEQVMAIGTVVLAAIGWGYHVRTRPSLFDAFTFFYVGALLPWSFHHDRYLLPVVPFIVLYVLLCVRYAERRIVEERLGWSYPVLLIATLGVFAFSYSTRYPRMEFEPRDDDPLGPKSQELYTYVRTHTRPDDIIVTHKPRILSWETGRYTMKRHAAPDSAVIAFYADFGVDYVLEVPADREDRVLKLATSHPDHFSLVFDNDSFQLFRYVPEADGREEAVPGADSSAVALPDAEPSEGASEEARSDAVRSAQ